MENKQMTNLTEEKDNNLDELKEYIKNISDIEEETNDVLLIQNLDDLNLEDNLNLNPNLDLDIKINQIDGNGNENKDENVIIEENKNYLMQKDLNEENLNNLDNLNDLENSKNLSESSEENILNIEEQIHIDEGVNNQDRVQEQQDNTVSENFNKQNNNQQKQEIVSPVDFELQNTDIRFQLISDIHGRFNRVRWDESADVILCAGDVSENVIEGMKFLKQAPAPVIFIPGNHEFYKGNYQDRVDYLKEECETSEGFITYADNDVLYLDNTRVISSTLWSNFNNFDPLLVASSENKMNDYFHIDTDHFFDKNLDLVDLHNDILKNYIKDIQGIMRGNNGYNKNFMNKELQNTNIRHKLGFDNIKEMLENVPYNGNKFSPAISYALHLKSIDFLNNMLSDPFEGKTVVMTHHAPSYTALSMSRYAVDVKAISMEPFLRRFVINNKIGSYASSLEHLASQYKIDAWVHGHLHDRMFYRLGSAAVHCNATGINKNDETRTGFDCYSFYVNDENKAKALINTLEHTIYKIMKVNKFLLKVLEDKIENTLFEDKDVLKGIFNEVYVLIRTLRSIPVREMRYPIQTYSNFYDLYDEAEQNLQLTIKKIINQNSDFYMGLVQWVHAIKKEI